MKEFKENSWTKNLLPPCEPSFSALDPGMWLLHSLVEGDIAWNLEKAGNTWKYFETDHVTLVVIIRTIKQILKKLVNPLHGFRDYTIKMLPHIPHNPRATELKFLKFFKEHHHVVPVMICVLNRLSSVPSVGTHREGMAEAKLRHTDLWLERQGTISQKVSLIARFMVPTWGPPGADRTQVGPMLAPWSLLSVMVYTLSPRLNGRHFAHNTLKCIFLIENVWI